MTGVLIKKRKKVGLEESLHSETDGREDRGKTHKDGLTVANADRLRL